MRYCCECGKKLRIFKAYLHPVLGKKNYVCYDCFEYINKSLGFYKNCLLKGRQNHKKECYFWDNTKKKCKNEKYFKDFEKKSSMILIIS